MRRSGRSWPRDPLEVTAGSDTSSDVAFAHALLRCGTPEELAENPDRRLRLTLGLHKEHGRWVVAHEHHSFTHPSRRPPRPRCARCTRIGSTPPPARISTD
ncbi:nuclear transport factor 2 family protein [Saccharopolyspora spinosa]|uniref:nuclear transport factor 2 family protein n=1 Tax=Saccharopolyspora spinosa TaxID=60894 RepID=UPI000A07A6FF|nr:nuclear transport factor 2 family protein [Saccharopolyspora spinosa]